MKTSSYLRSKILLFSIILFISGCKSIPYVHKSNLTKLETKIEQLEVEKQNEAAKTAAKIEEIKLQVIESEKDRYSKGTAQVYAADSTLEARPEQDKYTSAASKALDVAKEALPIPTVKDLLEANEIQKKLLSEQADKIAEAEKQLGIVKQEVLAAKNKEEELKKQQESIREEYDKKIAAINKDIELKESEWKKKNQELTDELGKKAAQYDYDNIWYRKYNPLTHITKFFSSLFFWIIIFVVLGGLLKIASIIFPGVNVIQVVVGGAGRIFGGFLKMIFGWIPDVFHGMGAVKEDDYKNERELANNVIGGVQEFKDAYPDLYKQYLKDRLDDWFKDTSPALKDIVDARIKELNLK
jgi:hypothetical protein